MDATQERTTARKRGRPRRATAAKPPEPQPVTMRIKKKTRRGELVARAPESFRRSIEEGRMTPMRWAALESFGARDVRRDPEMRRKARAERARMRRKRTEEAKAAKAHDESRRYIYHKALWREGMNVRDGCRAILAEHRKGINPSMSKDTEDDATSGVMA